MPHEQMDEQQVAAYLHLDGREVQRLAKRGRIPCRRVGGRFIFTKVELDHWIEAQMHGLDAERLRGIERGVSRHHGFEHEALLVTPLIPAGGVRYPMTARTGDSAIRELVSIAETAGLVYGRDELIGEVLHREEVCPTTLAPHLALPHPRHPLPNDIAASFIVVGLSDRGVPFGAIDGSLTRLFLLICCKDERTHLHVLARIALMFHDQRAVDALLAAESQEEILELLQRQEQAVME